MFLTTSDLRKGYGQGAARSEVLKGVSLSLDAGQLGVILGPSGSGKSTLMNIIGGVDRADSGQVEVDGLALAELGDAALANYRRDKLGFVFQFYNLIPNLTAAENVEVAAHIASDPLGVGEALAAVGLDGRERSFPKELSGGEQQRVAIARAIVKRPKLLLCDEPTGALDFETSRGVLELLQSVNQEYGATVLMITHNTAIGGLGDAVFRLRDGQIVETLHNAERMPAERIEW
ncbi:MAG: ABC transporter ATP-binding protein [Propionibacteriaceae bacterium]|jgi:putative ABC transport system ATP-binding protein|nr:ABC transporter ATP-binding protein [Propionibacteriaceae bacterium]